MLACKEEEAWQELVEGERRVRPMLLLGNPPNVSYHVAEHLDVDSGVAAPREGHVELPLKNSTLFKAQCISRDQPKRCRPKQKERIQKAESFCRKQKLTERPVFLQKEVSFCRKRLVSAERGRFLQKG